MSGGNLSGGNRSALRAPRAREGRRGGARARTPASGARSPGRPTGASQLAGRAAGARAKSALALPRLRPLLLRRSNTVADSSLVKNAWLVRLLTAGVRHNSRVLGSARSTLPRALVRSLLVLLSAASCVRWRGCQGLALLRQPSMCPAAVHSLFKTDERGLCICWASGISPLHPRSDFTVHCIVFRALAAKTAISYQSRVQL